MAALFLCCAPNVTEVSANQYSSIRIESIRFEGNRSISESQLKSLLRVSREGLEYIPGNLQADMRLVEKTYRDSGFLKVQLEPPEVHIQDSGEGKTAAIRIGIKEGPRYMTGRVAVKEAKALAPETLIQICPLQKDQPYSQIKAAQWREKVEDSYRALGYVRAQCPLREVINDFGKTVDCTMECTEGRIYTIGKISIAGNAPVNVSDFKRRLFFSEGGVFNPEMLSLTLQYLNQARLYEPISSSDIDLKVDDEKGIVDISLRVIPRVR